MKIERERERGGKKQNISPILAYVYDEVSSFFNVSQQSTHTQWVSLLTVPHTPFSHWKSIVCHLEPASKQ